MKRTLGILLLALAGCPASDDAPVDTDSDTSDTDAVDTDPADTDVEDTDVVDTDLDPACAAVVDRTFASLDEGECGLGQDGVVMCTWHVTFTATTWDWQHSDYGASGTYTCADGVITAVGSSAPAAASYDATTDQLTWDGVAYE